MQAWYGGGTEGRGDEVEEERGKGSGGGGERRGTMSFSNCSMLMMKYFFK